MKTSIKRRVRHKARRFITPAEVALLAAMIRDRQSNMSLTWADVIRLAEENFGYRWTRQTLYAHEAVRDAYIDHEKRHKQARSGKRVRRTGPETQLLKQDKDRLKREIEGLRETLRKYDELLCRYLFNAGQHGVSAEDLATPLRPPNRKQTEEPKLKPVKT